MSPRRWNRFGVLVAVPAVILALAVAPAAAADPAPVPEPGTESTGLGDPIFGDDPAPGDPGLGDSAPAGEPLRERAAATSGLTALKSWSPALTTGAATSAYIDVSAGRVFQASRSENPARMFTNKLDGASVAVANLPDTTGSWEMTVSGNVLAVGTNGNGSVGPQLVLYNAKTSAKIGSYKLPSTTSASGYVMALAADPSKSGAFWVGTYDPNGADLYYFQSGQFTRYTPGDQWASAGLKYVRSLIATGEGVFAGMGNPASVWFLKSGNKTPVHLSDALKDLNASTVYALAPAASSTKGDPGEDDSPEGTLDPGFDTEESAGTEAEDGDAPAGKGGDTEVAPEEIPAEEDADSAPEDPLDPVTREGDAPQSADQDPAADEDDDQFVDEEAGESGADLSEGIEATPLPSSLDDADPAPASSARAVVGTNTPASVQVLDGAGKNIYSYKFNSGEATVDRIAVDEDNVAWFTVRPTGDLYCLDLRDLSSSSQPERVTSTVAGAETRALDAHDGVVRGVTGTRELWTYDALTPELSSLKLSRGKVAEGVEAVPQGVLVAADALLVGGHWRYQVHQNSQTFDIGIPGEPKAQVRVGSRVFSAVYPSASLYEVDVNSQVSTFVARAPVGQVRPRALTYSEPTGKLYMATSSSYGTYGGGISEVSPDADGSLNFYNTPVSKQMPAALSPIGKDLAVGTSAAGEAVSAPAGARAHVVRWNSQRTVWNTTLPKGSVVAGVATISDDAGEFVFATTGDGQAYALDGGSGRILWQTSLPSSGNRVTAVGDYVLVNSGLELIEYFPSRTALTRGLTLTNGSAWSDMQPRSGGGYEVGFVAAKSTSATRARIANPREVTRTRGANRYTTGEAVSRSTYTSSKYAVIATGLDFPDALSAGPLAAALDGPVLLSHGKQVPSEVQSELSRLKVSTVYIAGGTGVIPTSVESGLRAKGYTVKRLAGKDRYGTAAQVADEIRRVTGKSSIPIVLTTGRVFPDALSATPAAAEMQGAILLTNGDSLGATTAQFVRSKATTVVAVGGPARRAANAGRVSLKWTASGSDRYGTSAQVASRMFPNAKTAYLATGADYPDGLTAGPAAAHNHSPVLLSPENRLVATVTPALRKTNDVRLVGGTGVLMPALAKAIRSL